MSFQEKNAWATLVITVVGVGAYLLVVVSRADGGPLTDVAYQAILLAAIGLAIVASIVAHIAISTTSREGAEKPDERDREIERFSSHVGHALVIVGGVAALGMAMAEWNWFWIAHALYLGFALAAVVESVARIAAYRVGLPPW